MDLLGCIREEAGDEETTRRARMHGAYGRNAQALLLVWLSSSLTKIDNNDS
jgi:hypothetical protein